MPVMEPGWAIVELMGYRCLAGRVSEVTRFGVPLCRIEMDRGPCEEPLVQEYGGAAMFGLTWCDEATVRAHQARGQYAGPVTLAPYRPALSFDPRALPNDPNEDGAYPQDRGCTCAAGAGEQHAEECRLATSRDDRMPVPGDAIDRPVPLVERLEHGRWKRIDFDDLRVGDVFRQESVRGGFGPPYQFGPLDVFTQQRVGEMLHDLASWDDTKGVHHLADAYQEAANWHAETFPGANPADCGRKLVEEAVEAAFALGTSPSSITRRVETTLAKLAIRNAEGNPLDELADVGVVHAAITGRFVCTPPELAAAMRSKLAINRDRAAAGRWSDAVGPIGDEGPA